MYQTMNAELDEISQWFKANKPSLNLYIDNKKLPLLYSSKFLGVIIDEKWQWDDHIKYIKQKLASG